jgi:hypothetical protein
MGIAMPAGNTAYHITLKVRTAVINMLQMKDIPEIPAKKQSSCLLSPYLPCLVGKLVEVYYSTLLEIS